MEPRELSRMFDALAPTPEQEQAILDRLLQTERKGRPMKKWQKITVIGVAAALLLMTCAAAVVALDRRLLDYFGANQEQAELLAPGAVAADVSVENNGATFRVTQVLRDRYSILMTADFTAPDGTKLEIGGEDNRFLSFGQKCPELLDGDGASIPQESSIGWNLAVLEQPADNRLSLLYTVELMDGIGSEAQTAVLSNVDLRRFDDEKEEMVTVYAGDWSCTVPLPQKDTGWSCTSGAALELPDAVVYGKEVYLSPMSLEFTLELGGLEEDLTTAEQNRLRRLYLTPYEVTLTDQTGQKIALGTEMEGFGAGSESICLFRLPEIMDPARFRGGSLSFELDGQTFTLPLDDLAPVE